MFDISTAGRLLQMGNTSDLHRILDALQPVKTDEDRFHLAYWRAAALSREKRFSEALEHLRRYRSDFPCQTASHDEAARILEHLGCRNEAIAELKLAPFAEEAERFPLLVKDARFLLLSLLVKSGSLPLDPTPDEFPAHYCSVLPNSKHCYAEHTSLDQIKEWMLPNLEKSLSDSSD